VLPSRWLPSKMDLGPLSGGPNLGVRTKMLLAAPNNSFLGGPLDRPGFIPENGSRFVFQGDSGAPLNQGGHTPVSRGSGSGGLLVHTPYPHRIQFGRLPLGPVFAVSYHGPRQTLPFIEDVRPELTPRTYEPPHTRPSTTSFYALDRTNKANPFPHPSY